MGILEATVFAFLGGMILNLMPCVFPVLAMKALTVVNSKNLSSTERWKDTGFYSLGILFFFWILYFLFLILKSGGSSLGWGFQLQNPGFIFLLVFFFIFMAFQMLGWIEFSLGVSGKLAQLTSQKSGLGSFLSGGVAVLVATPCTAPFMGSALAFAFSSSPLIGFIVFTSLGLGMALPLVLVQNVPFLSKFLPRPGAWMITFKEILAFPLLLTAAWLFWVFMGISGKDESFYILACLVFLFFLIWLSKKINQQALRLTVYSFLILSIFGIAYSTERQTKEANTFLVPQSLFQKNVWEAGYESSATYSKDNLQLALESGQPVFLYFTADWCVTCKYNEKTVFRTDSVLSFLKDNNVLVLKADWTNEDPEISKVLESYGRNGVPLYVYYKKGRLSKPIFLSQILTPDIALQEMKL